MSETQDTEMGVERERRLAVLDWMNKVTRLLLYLSGNEEHNCRIVAQDVANLNGVAQSFRTLERSRSEPPSEPPFSERNLLLNETHRLSAELSACSVELKAMQKERDDLKAAYATEQELFHELGEIQGETARKLDAAKFRAASLAAALQRAIQRFEVFRPVAQAVMGVMEIQEALKAHGGTDIPPLPSLPQEAEPIADMGPNGGSALLTSGFFFRFAWAVRWMGRSGSRRHFRTISGIGPFPRPIMALLE